MQGVDGAGYPAGRCAINPFFGWARRGLVKVTTMGITTRSEHMVVRIVAGSLLAPLIAG